MRGRDLFLGFSPFPTDRLGLRRRDRAWLERSLSDPATRFVPVVGMRHPVEADEDEEAPRPVLLTPEEAAPLVREESMPILLGDAPRTDPAVIMLVTHGAGSEEPWPFPGSIMLGFTARARTVELRLDEEEIEDARWLGREEIRREVAAGTLRLPSGYSIARYLVEGWLEGGRDER